MFGVLDDVIGGFAYPAFCRPPAGWSSWLGSCVAPPALGSTVCSIRDKT